MADQWASTQDHSPVASPPSSSGWASTEDHSPQTKPDWDYDVIDAKAKAERVANPGPSAMSQIGTSLKNQAKGFFDTLTGLMSPYDVGPGGIVKNDIAEKTGEGILQSHIDQWEKAKEAHKSGDTFGAIIHGLAAAVPILGPMAEQTGEKFNTRPYEAATDVAVPVALAGVSRASEALPERVPIIPKIIRKVEPSEVPVVQYAESHNIPVNASVRTGSKPLANVESYLTNAVGSAKVMKKAAAATNEGLKNAGADLVEQPGAGRSNYPVAATPESAGESIQAGAADRDAAIALAKKETDAAMEAKGKDIASKVSPSAATEESAGSGVADTLKSTADTHGAGASAAYSKLRDAESNPVNIKAVPVGPGKIPDSVQAELEAVSRSLAGKSFDTLNDAEKAKVLDTAKKLGIDPTPQPETQNMAFPTDMRGAKSALKPILDQLLQEPADVLNRSRALPAIKALVNGPDYVPASVAEDYLSGAKAIIREGVNAKTKYLAGKAVDAVQPLIDEAVGAGGKDAIDALQEGRALTKAKYATLNTLDQLPTEPVQIYRKLAAPGDAHISLLRDVKAKAPGSIPAVARATVEGLLEDGKTGGASKALAQWGKLGDATKLELLGSPEAVSTLDKYFTSAAEIEKSPVPPGMEGPSGKVPGEPVKAYAQLLRDRDTAITALRQAANNSLESIPQVARAKLQELVDAATAQEGTRPGPDAAFSAWNKMGDETKRMLYPDPKVRQDISDFLSTAKKVANASDRNTSRTAYVAEAAHAVTILKTGLITLGSIVSGGTYVLTNYALAKILTTPGGARLLTEGLSISGKGAASAARSASITSRLLAIAGSDAKKMEAGSPAITDSAAQYKPGDTVNLKGVGQVTIKAVNPDGTFEY